MNKYQVVAPCVPGAQPTIQGEFRTLAAARKAAAKFRHRGDLAWPDVRIDRMDGSLVEYAGPDR